MADSEQLLLPLAGQWNEQRGFERLYFRNPAAQARFVQALLGFRQTFIEFQTPSVEDQETVEAIETVVQSFAKAYPEFLESTYQEESDLGSGLYSADPHVTQLVRELETNE